MVFSPATCSDDRPNSTNGIPNREPDKRNSCGNDGARGEAVLVGRGGGGTAAGLAAEEAPGGNVPGLDAELPIGSVPCYQFSVVRDSGVSLILIFDVSPTSTGVPP